MKSTELTYKLHHWGRIAKRISEYSINVFLLLASLAALGFMAYEYGYNITPAQIKFLISGYRIILQIFFFGNLLDLLLNPKIRWKDKGFWVEVIVLGLLLFVILTQSPGHFANERPLFKTDHILVHILLFLLSSIQLSKNIVSTFQRRIKAEMMFAYSFLFFILAGAVLLLLPNAHQGQLTFIDALFTAASAVCVTGLTVVDTASTFTIVGQVILLILIQIGGVGVMTFTSFIAMSFFNKTTFQDQIVLKSILNEESMNNIFRTLFYTLFTTLTIESVGAYLLWLQISDLPHSVIPHKIFFSVFHAVSSFCNAGFSTLPGNLYDPAVRGLYNFQFWIALLIILGGIGFPIVFNYGKLFNHKLRNLFYRLTRSSKRMPSHVRIVSTTTRVVILTTAVLLFSSTLLFWVLERHNTLSGLDSKAQLATAFFSAVTPRTAGFNTLPVGHFLSPTLFLTLFLMWIGASPMSAGGGIKTTTFTIALKSIYMTIIGKSQVEIAQRRLNPANLHRATTIIFLSLSWITIATLILSLLEPQGSFMQVLFEVVSALSTVGLSIDFTPTLSTGGKILISLTMFAGRVGLFTILTGIFRQHASQNYTYAEDNVIL